MKKQILTLFLGCFLLNANAVRWTELNAVGYPQPQSEVAHSRSQGLIFNINNKIYYGGGLKESLFTTNYFTDFQQYDSTTDKWTPTSSFPFIMDGVSSNQSFTLNNKGYFFYTNNSTWEFDPVVNQWTQKMNYPGLSRTSPAAFSANGKGYISLGIDSASNYLLTTYEYDGTANSWTPKSNFPGAGRISMKTFSFANGGFIYGGNSPQLKFDSWYYDATNDNWISKSPLNETLGIYNFNFTVGNNGYLVNDSTVWQYDLNANAWTQKQYEPRLSHREWCAIGSVNSGYAVNGHSIYRYDPVADKWKMLHDPATLPPYCTVYNDDVYFDGWKYNIITGNWTGDSLYSGRWMFALGSKVYGMHNNLFMEYDPVTMLWTAADSLPATAISISFSLLGKGYYINNLDLYEYDPSSNHWTQKTSFPGTEITDGVVFTNNDVAYYGLGYATGFGSGEFWKYNSTTDSWLRLSDGPAFGAMYYATIGTKGYCGGGDIAAASNTNEELREYDMATDTWKSLSGGCYRDDAPTVRKYCYGFSYQNYIYAGGGQDMYSIYELPLYFDLWKADPYSLVINGTLPTHLCVNETYYINYSSTSEFDSSNQFMIELSNVNGYFNGTSFLQTYSSYDSSGVLAFSIPPGNYTGGNYRIRLLATSPSDCKSYTQSFSISSVSVNNFAGQLVNIIPGQQYNYSVALNNSLNYQWNIQNGNLISGQGTNNVTIEWNNVLTGEIEIIATDSTCSDTLHEIVNINTTNVGNLNSLQPKIFPNPFSDFTTIDFGQNISGGTFTLYDLIGRVVYTSTIDGESFVLKRGKLIDGGYVYRVVSAERNGFGVVEVGGNDK